MNDGFVSVDYIYDYEIDEITDNHNNLIYVHKGVMGEDGKPSGTITTKQYHYGEGAEEPEEGIEDLGAYHYPTYLTGITDELNNRFANFYYDSETGRAVSTEHAGQAEKIEAIYPELGIAIVKEYRKISETEEDLERIERWTFGKYRGKYKKTSVEILDCNAACSESESSVLSTETWNFNATTGLLDSYTDRSGLITVYVYFTEAENSDLKDLLKSKTIGVDEHGEPLTIAQSVAYDYYPNRKLKAMFEANLTTQYIYNSNDELENQIQCQANGVTLCQL